MADAFSSYLSEVKAPAGPDTVKRAEMGSIRTNKAGIGTALEGAGNLLEGAASLASYVAGKETDKQVDAAINTAAEEAGFPIEAGGSLSSGLERLKLIQDSAIQKGDPQSFERFQLSLASTFKTMKSNNPHMIGSIDKKARELGLTDPRIALVQNRIDKEKSAQDVITKRNDALITAAVTGGVASYIDGDINRVDQKATLQTMNDMAVRVAKNNADWAAIGYPETADGKPGSRPTGQSLEYAKRAPGMKQNKYDDISTVLGPLGVRLTSVINSGADEATQQNELKALAQEMTGKARQFILGAEAQSVGLRAEEKKDFMDAVNSMVLPFVQMALPIASTGDLNAAKTAAMTLEIFNDQAKMFAWDRSPAVKRLVESLPKEVSAMLLSQLAQKKEMQELMAGAAKGMAAEFKALFDMTPKGVPKDHPFTEFKEKEDQHGDTVRKERVSLSAQQMQAYIDNGVVVGENALHAEHWLRAQIPIEKALHGVSDQKLTDADISKIVGQRLSGNYFANLTSANRHFPEGGKIIGESSYKLVRKHLDTQIRSLQNDDAISVEWSNSNNRLTAITKNIDGDVVQNLPRTENSIEEANKALAFVRSTKQFNDADSKLTDRELIEQIVSDISTNYGRKGTDPLTMTPAQIERAKAKADVPITRAPQPNLVSLRGETVGKKPEVKERSAEDENLGPIVKDNAELPIALAPAEEKEEKKAYSAASAEARRAYDAAKAEWQRALSVIKAELNKTTDAKETEGPIVKEGAFDPKVIPPEKVKEEEKVIIQGMKTLREDAPFIEYLMVSENSRQRGRTNDGTWFPHASHEGGTPTVGYGHKLQPSEIESGVIKLDGKDIKYTEGLTDQQVKSLLNQDLKSSYEFIDARWKLTSGQRDALADIVYNMGRAKFTKEAPKAIKALNEGNTEEAAKQLFDRKAGITRIHGKINDVLVERRAEAKRRFWDRP